MCLLLVSALRLEYIAIHLKAIIVGVFVLTLWEPGYGLLLVAASVPLARLFTPGVPVPPLRLAEAIVLAFLAGWAVDLMVRSRSGPSHQPHRRDIFVSASWWLFAAVVIASAFVELAVIQPLTDRVDDFLRHLWVFLSSYYLLPTGEFLSLTAATLLLEGIGLLSAVIALSRDDQRLPGRLLAVSAAAGFAVASLAVGRFVIALAQDGFQRWPRISAQVADLNAAGSYLVLILPSACLFAVRWSRRLAAATAVWLGMAVWLTGSRTAAAAAILAGMMVVAARRMPDLLASRKRVALAVVACAAAIGVSAALASVLVVRSDPSAPRWLDLRLGFTTTSLKMIASAPAFGIGVGRYYPMSGAFMSPELRRIYTLENAHNNFFQIAAELGLVGGILFVWMIARALSSSTTALRSRGENTVLLGAFSGTFAYLLTCLTGHPLLVYETAYPFWLVMGCAVGVSQTEPEGQRSKVKGHMLIVAAAMALILASIPFRVASETRMIDLSGVSYGLGNPEKDTRADRVFRRATGTATLFVRSDAQAVDLPVRLLNVSPEASADVRLALDGRPANQKQIDDEWTTIGVRFPSNPADRPFRRLDLSVICAPAACPENGLGALAIGDLQVR
jgi:O-antigen ligase